MTWLARLALPLLALAPALAPAAGGAPQDARRVADLVRRGRAHLEAGRPERALELFEQADAETRGGLAERTWVLRTWFELGRVNDAFDLVDALAAEHPDAPEVAYLYGIGSWFRARRHMAGGVDVATVGLAFQDAQTFLAAALSLAPERFPDAWGPLAEAAWRNQDLQTAQDAAARDALLHPDDVGATFMEGRVQLSRWLVAAAGDEAARSAARPHLDHAVRALRRARGLIAEPAAEAPLAAEIARELGVALQWAEERAGALEAYADSLGWDPDALPYADYRAALGLEDFTTVLTRGRALYLERWGVGTPGEATLLWWLGAAQREAERWPQSEEAFLAAVERWPAYTNAWWYAGLARYHQADYEGAIAAWHEHWKADATDLVATVQSDREANLAILEWLVGWCVGRSGPPEGLREYDLRATFLCEVLCAVAPEDWRHWNDRGLSARDAGRFLAERGREGDAQAARGLWETSVQAYEEALRRAPERPHLHNDLAVVLQYDLQRDLQRARELYGRAIALADEQLAAGTLTGEDRSLAEQARSDARLNLEALDAGDGDGEGGERGGGGGGA